MRPERSIWQKLRWSWGGNDAFIVCEDADIDQAVEEVVLGRITTSGQICIGSKRILVQNSIKDEFTKKLVARFGKVKQGNVGPVAPVIGFDTVEEAIDIANQTQYGLGGCVFSSNIKTAMKVANEMVTGSVNINGSTLFRSHEMPFGGCKNSGIGREGVGISFEEVTQQKVIILRNVL